MLASKLSNLTRTQEWKDQETIEMEHEILKCLKTILNSKVSSPSIALEANLILLKHGTRVAVDQPKCVVNIAMSLTSPHIPSRKIVADILIYIAHREPPTGHNLLLRALDQLMELRQEQSRFDAWFAVFELTIDGRGKMGTVVGASTEVRSLRGADLQAAQAAANGQVDSVLSEYAVCLHL